MKAKLSVIYLFIFFASSCSTDPVIPASRIPLSAPVQDPGENGLCDNGIISFHHQVLPIMVSTCAYSGCHDAATAEDGVVLDSYENIIKEITPGDPDDSEVYESVTENEPDEIMPPPPDKPLNQTQIALIKEWILQGANNTDCGTLCDSTATSFSADIFPLLENYCIGCHNSNRTDGNVNIESYDNIMPYVNNGSFLGSIKHDLLFPIKYKD